MVSLGDIIDRFTGGSKDRKKGERGTGILEGLHMHFHISINLVMKDREAQ